MSFRFNAPPNWPTPPAGWVPPPGWVPDPAWGPPPPGWQLWVQDDPTPAYPAVVPAIADWGSSAPASGLDIPRFGARGKARELAVEVTQLREEVDHLRAEMNRLGVFRPSSSSNTARDWNARLLSRQLGARQRRPSWSSGSVAFVNRSW